MATVRTSTGSAPRTSTHGAPPPKKQKKPKLSKAERKRLKALRALELKKNLVKDQLLRELELTKGSMKRGTLKWEQLCRQIKVIEFQHEIEGWAIEAQQVLEKKDKKIEDLVQNLDETLEMHERGFCRHLDSIEHLTNCHKALYETATKLYNSQATDLIEDYLYDLGTVQDIQDKIKLNNENMMHTTNIICKTYLRENYELYMTRKFKEATSEAEKRYIVRDKTVKRMNDLHDQLLSFIKELQAGIVEARKTENYLHFMQRQSAYVIESQKLNEIERISQRTISDLKQELLQIEATTNRKIYGLKLEQAYFLKARSIIESSIIRGRQLTHEKMLQVCSDSFHVIKKLKEYVKQGELLLGLAACCRKYQTEKEKILPFPASTDNSPADELKMTLDVEKFFDISEEKLADIMHLFRNFWRRCSDVAYQNLLLKQEKAKLTEENEKYRDIIRSMRKSEDVQDILESLKIKQLS